MLVRIDPHDAAIDVVGKVNPVGHPTFVGNDLYLSTHLRRLRGVAKQTGTR